VGAFNTCAVTKNKCVTQIPDDGAIKVPSPDQLVQSLNTADMDGRWYIASGLNKLFDIFDCQASASGLNGPAGYATEDGVPTVRRRPTSRHAPYDRSLVGRIASCRSGDCVMRALRRGILRQVHYFTAPEPGKMYAKLNWRVSRPNGQFYERSDIQTFEQDPNAPGILYNHDNEFLHYQDDWYIAAFDPNDYMFVYYRGSNDAWDGYGGAVIYSRTPELNPAAEPVLRETAKRARPLSV
jgi:hypothetical protein